MGIIFKRLFYYGFYNYNYKECYISLYELILYGLIKYYILYNKLCTGDVGRNVCFDA